MDNEQEDLLPVDPMLAEEQDYPDISSQMDESLSLKQPLHQVWDTCLSYTRGQQSPLGSGVGGESSNYNTGARRRRTFVVNQVLPLYKNIAARLTVAYPSIAVMPASDTPDDVAKARASTMLLQYIWKQAKVKNVLNQANQILVACGSVGLHERYDSATQSIVLESVLPHDLLFEPYLSNELDSEWVAIRRYSTRAELTRTFPEQAEAIKEFASPPAMDSNKRVGPRMLPQNRVEYREVYWRDGRHAFMMGGTFLYKGRFPAARIPIQLIKYTPIPGYLWGSGLVEPLIDLQTMYNDFRTQIILNAKMMTNPKILVPDGCLKEPGKAFSSAEGEKVYYNPEKGAPSPWQSAALPQYLTMQPALLQSEMQDVASIHAVSLGKRAVGLTSGKAINALAENDMSQLSMTQESIEEAVQEAATCMLLLAKAYYTEAKYTRMLDRSGRLVFSSVESTTVEDDPEVFLEAGSLFRSEAGDREAKALDLLGAGLITPEEAKRAITFRTEPYDVIQDLEEQQHAQELLDAVVQLGADIELFPTDNFKAIEQVFRRFLRSHDFYRLPPEVQNKVSSVYRDVLQNINGPAPRAVNPQAAAPSAADPFAEASQGFTDNAAMQGQVDQMAETAEQFTGGGAQFNPGGE
jgi:hypothetical protein